MTKRFTWIRIAVMAIVAFPLPAAAQTADAYADVRAEELVHLARARRSANDQGIVGYTTTAREHITLRMRAPISDRLLIQRETVSNIDWSLNAPTRIEVTGARDEGALAAASHVPIELGHIVGKLAFDPTNPDVLLVFDTTIVRHPLAEGSEASYRFAAGDTATVRLSDGTIVRLMELRVTARRRDPQLVNGSFWLDADSHALVRAYFRLAAAYDGDVDDIRRFASLAHFLRITGDDGGPPEPEGSKLSGLIRPVRAELEFIALDYALWDRRYWMPRSVAWRGVLQVGRATFPGSYERLYGEYVVRGTAAASSSGTTSTPGAPSASASAGGVPVAGAGPTPAFPRCRPLVSFQTNGSDVETSAMRQARADTLRARQNRLEALLQSRRAEWGGTLPPLIDCAQEIVIHAAADSVLRASPDLSEPSSESIQLLTDAELSEILGKVGKIPDAICCSGPPRLDLLFQGPGLVRYNRVEALSLGARTSWDVSATLRLKAEARIGLADGDPRGEVGLEHRGVSVYWQLAAYRRLATVAPDARVHGTLASASALLFGRDREDYFDALGGELVLRPGDVHAQTFDLRLYAERQRAVTKNTDLSVAHLLNQDRVFPENFAADPADQLGANVRLRGALGRPSATSLGGEISLGAETGDYDLFRVEAVASALVPLDRRLSVGLEAAAGTVKGDGVPAQSLWRLGGTETLRGYERNVFTGERYWRGRAEIRLGPEGRGISVFTDAAWTGDNSRLDAAGVHYSTGVGLGLLGGVVRIDLARALTAPTGWRLHLHAFGPF